MPVITVMTETDIKCDHLSKNPHSLHKHVYRKKNQILKLFVKLRMLLQKFTRIDGASNQWRKLQINKNYIPSYSPGYGEFENRWFVSAAWTVSVSRVFVYNAIDVSKITTALLAKLPP